MKLPENLFKVLPLLLVLQIAAAFLLASPADTAVIFPESDAQIQVEVADSPEERAQGLMYRRSLELNRGMLFVFPEEDYRSFWMKNTYIPLDMIFIGRNGEIINIEEAHPQPNASDNELKSYRSDEPAKYVIETNSTFTEKENAEKGDRVEIPTRY